MENKGVVSLRRNRAHPLAFRAMVGREASELAQTKKDSYLAEIVRKHFAFADLAWSHSLTEDEKKTYRKQREEVDTLKRLIFNWRKEWEAGKLRGYEDAPKTAIRARGAGPPLKTATLEDLLTRFYVHVTQERLCACPRSLVKVKAAQLVCAAREEAAPEVASAFLENGKVDMVWVEEFVKRWAKRCGLKIKTPTVKVKIPQGELVFRIHVFFRNLTRARAAFEPRELQVDVYDHSPFFRRMANKSTLGVPGVRSEILDNTGDSRTRFTVVVPGSTDCTAQNPSILFKAADATRTNDYESVRITAGRKVYVQYNATPTYNEAATLKLLENQYANPSVQDFRENTPRIIVFDQFSGQITERCIKAMIKYRKVPLVIWGGLTSLLQPADLYQIKQLKALYRANEQARLLQIQMAQPDRVPQMQRTDVVAAVAKSWTELVSRDGYAAAMNRTFAKSGITAKLDGSTDRLMSSELKRLLDDPRGSSWAGERCSFFEWRAKYLASMPPPPRSKGVPELLTLLENPYSKADRERFSNAFLNEKEAEEATEDVAFEGIPCAAEEAENSDQVAEERDSAMAVGVCPRPAEAEAANQKEPQADAAVDSDRCAANAEGQNTRDAHAVGASEPQSYVAVSNNEDPYASASDAISKELIKEKYGTAQARKLAPVGCSRIAFQQSRISRARDIGLLLDSLEQAAPENVRMAETAILEGLTTVFKTPSIVARLRDLCQKEKKTMAAADAAVAAKVAARAMQMENDADLEKNNEIERDRVAWAAAKNMAEAASLLFKKKGLQKVEKQTEKKGPGAQKGRKRKYATDEERKAARKEAAKKRRLGQRAQGVDKAVAPPGGALALAQSQEAAGVSAAALGQMADHEDQRSQEESIAQVTDGEYLSDHLVGIESDSAWTDGE